MATTIDTLTTRMEADIQKFEEAMKKMQSASKATADRIKADQDGAATSVAKSWDKVKASQAAGAHSASGHGGGESGFQMPSLNLGKANIAEGLDNVVKDIKSQALEEGASQLGVFGGALEALGPYGLAAAAGLAAVAVGAEATMKAMEWAEELSRTAEELGMTTTELQKLQFIMGALGIPADKANESFKGLAIAVGNVADGAAKTRQVKVLEQLGFTEDQLKNCNDISELLPQLADRLSELSAPTRASVARILKIDPDVVQSLVEAKDKLGELGDAAESSGSIIESKYIRQSNAAQEATKKASEEINDNFRRAFIELAPSIQSVEGFIAKCAKALADFIVDVEHAIAPIANLIAKIGQIPGFKNAVHSSITAMIDATPGARAVVDEFHKLSSEGKAQDDARLKAQGFDKPEERPHPTHQLDLGNNKPKHEKKAPEDETANLNQTVAGLTDAADKALDQAKLALAGDLDSRAAIEKDIAAKEYDAEIARLEKQKNDINKAVKDKHESASSGAAQIAEVNNIEALDKETQSLKTELAARQNAIAKIEQDATLHQMMVASQTAALSRQEAYDQNMAALATTLAAKQDWEKQALADAQARQTLQAQAAVDAAQAQVKVATSAEALAKAQQALADALAAQKALPQQQAQERQVQAKNQQQQTPGGALINSLSDVNKQLEDIKAQGLNSLTDAITGAIMKTKSLKDAFHEMAMQVVTDLVKIGVQQAIEKPLANLMFGGQGQGGMGGKSGGGFLGGLFGGGTAPDGSQNKPFFVTMAGLNGSTGGAGGLAGLLGDAGKASGAAGGTGGILSTLMAFLPAFAGGTDDAPGGPALVGENGPEIVNLNKGDSVLTNPKTMQALGAAPSGSQNGGSNEIHFHNVVYANDALLEGNIRAMIAHGNMATLQAAKNIIPTDQSRARRQSFF